MATRSNNDQISTSLWWSIAEIRKGRTSLPMLRRRRSNRACHATHALWPIIEVQYQLLHRIFRARSDHGGWRVQGRNRIQPGRRHITSIPSPQHSLGNRRLRARILQLHVSPYVHGRWHGHGCSCRSPQPRSRIRPVPPHWHLRRRLPHHRRFPGRRRLSPQL